MEPNRGLVGLLIGAAAIFCLGAVIGIYTAMPFIVKSHSPRAIVPARKDFNGDKVPDLIVVKNNEGSVLMLSTPQGTQTMYLSPEEYANYTSKIITPRDLKRAYERMTEP